MKDRFYGDKRDVVKWSALAHLSRQYSVDRILQVAFWGPDKDSRQLLINGEPATPISPEVWKHFRDIRHIKQLKLSPGVEIEVFRDEFRAPRRAYIDSVARRVCDRRECRRLLVFLDPDTGIAPPSGGDLRHIRPGELDRIYSALHGEDVLVLYQHARLGVRDWVAKTRSELVAALRVDDSNVCTFTCPSVAGDVAFFAVAAGVGSTAP